MSNEPALPLRSSFACCDRAFPLLTHQASCRLVAQLGFEAIDLGLISGKRNLLDPAVVLGDPVANAERVGSYLADAGLKVADVFLISSSNFAEATPNHPDPAVRDVAAQLFHSAVTFAERLGADGVGLLPGIDWESEDHAASLRRSADELAWRVDVGASHGLRVSVEAHIGSVISQPEDAAALIDFTPGLGLTLDLSHFVYQGISHDDIAPLVPLAQHVHVRSARRGRLQVGMQDNVIDFERFMESLAAADYDGWVALEYVWNAWERCNENDNVTEILLLSDRLSAKLAGREWSLEAAFK